MFRIPHLWFGGLVILWAGHGYAHADEYRNEASRFRLQLPDGWARFAPGKLFELQLKAAQGKKLVDGFEPRGMGNQPTQVLVIEEEQQDRLTKLSTFHEIDKELQGEFRKEFERGAGKNARLGPLILERAKNRFTATAEMTAPNGIRVNVQSYGYLGKDRLVVLHFFARENEFAESKKIFEKSADSFVFDDGFAYEALDSPRNLWVGGSACGGCCCCGLTGFMGLLGLKMLFGGSRRRGRRKRRRD